MAAFLSGRQAFFPGGTGGRRKESGKNRSPLRENAWEIAAGHGVGREIAYVRRFVLKKWDYFRNFIGVFQGFVLITLIQNASCISVCRVRHAYGGRGMMSTNK